MVILVRVGLVAFGSKIAAVLFWSILRVLFTGEVLEMEFWIFLWLLTFLQTLDPRENFIDKYHCKASVSVQKAEKIQAVIANAYVWTP